MLTTIRWSTLSAPGQTVLKSAKLVHLAFSASLNHRLKGNTVEFDSGCSEEGDRGIRTYVDDRGPCCCTPVIKFNGIGLKGSSASACRSKNSRRLLNEMTCMPASKILPSNRSSSYRLSQNQKLQGQRCPARPDRVNSPRRGRRLPGSCIIRLRGWTTIPIECCHGGGRSTLEASAPRSSLPCKLKSWTHVS
jgi:hypothetical protein